jgi:hypothetical protein
MTSFDDAQDMLHEIAQEIGFAETIIEEVAKEIGATDDEDGPEDEPEPEEEDEPEEEEEPAGLICHRCGDGRDIVVRRTLVEYATPVTTSDDACVEVTGSGTVYNPYHVTAYAPDVETESDETVLYCNYCHIELNPTYRGRHLDISLE